MKQKIGYTALVVRDYDEAVASYTEVLCFNLIRATHLGGGKQNGSLSGLFSRLASDCLKGWL
ncbi:MAG: VOC family protein [Acidobacteriia bacterium]|nr:VOC family protein [Terriglobia bacterium]